jgi:hypothetical protein
MKSRTKEYYTEYYEQNKDAHNARSVEWQSKNKDKAKESVKKYQEKNIDKVREWDRLQKQKQRQERRQFIDECKSTCSCKKCGDVRPYILDFHHIDPNEKEFDLGEASKYSITRLKIELEKCITLCRNCHSEFHFLEKKQNITIEKYLYLGM